MLVLSASELRELLTPAVAFAAARDAMSALHEPGTYQPVRALVDAPYVPGVTLLKPAAIGAGYGLKVASLFPGNVERGLATIQGFVALLDAQTGAIDALLDAAVVTEVRTAAVSAVATDALAGTGSARLGLLGAGAQARSHLLALSEVRELDEVRVWSPRSANAFVNWAKQQGVSVQSVSTEEVVRESSIVCAVTTSPTPVLLGAWLAPGTHVNAVGAFRPTERELDTAAIERSTVFVDSRESALAEAGAILVAGAQERIAAELTDVLTGQHPGRASAGEITVFSSTGLAVQDIAVARAAVAAARSAGRGMELDLS